MTTGDDLGGGLGHNAATVRLGALAENARGALDLVARGETDAITGWLAYGAALNEGRSLFPGDKEFGEWVENCALRQVGGAEVHDHERAAAMWAAANADQFAEARAAGNARTVRGIHAVWRRLTAARAAEAADDVAATAAHASTAPAAEPAEDATVETTALDQGADDPDASTAPAGDGPDDADADDPDEADAAQRAALRRLTRTGLEDEVIGLRAENADLRRDLARATAEARRLKALLGDLTADDSRDVIRRQAQKIEHLESRRWRAEDDARRAVRARRLMQDERDKALRELDEARRELARFGEVIPYD